MEVIFQWLDDCEDLVFSFVLTCERLRPRCLQTGLAAALILLAIEIAEVRTPWSSTFAWAALASVALWLATLIAVRLLGLQRVSYPASGQSNA